MINIQKTTKDDIYSIQQVFYKTWLSTYPNKEAGITKEDVEERFRDRFSENALSKRKKQVLSQSPDYISIVAKNGDDIIGFCEAKKGELYNELKSIYVLPNYQGKGIGMMLWNEIVNFLGNEKKIIVCVATYNQQAIDFYKKIGFTDTNKRFTKEQYRMPISKALVPEMEMILDAKNPKYII